MSFYTGNSIRFGALGAVLRKGDAIISALVGGAISFTTKTGQNLTMTANAVVVAARTVFNASTAQVLAAGTAISPNAAVVYVTCSGDVTLTGTPTITDGADGQELLIVNTDTADSVTLQDAGTLASSGLHLATDTVKLEPLDSIRLRYILASDKWVETARAIYDAPGP